MNNVAQYKSILNKNGLAYNIMYHLNNMTDTDSIYEIIEKVLTNFELKDIENS